MKLLVAYQKGSKNLLKIGMDDGAEKWATTTSAVVAYAKKNFKEGEEAKFEMTEKNGQYHVTKILKADGSSSSEPTADPAPTEYKCSDCGAKLKDGKYKKCYACNKKNPASKTEDKKTSYKEKPDSVGNSIEKQAMMKAAANAVATGMQAQFQNADTLAEMIIVVYNKLLAELRK
jgi:hypothetical protein